MATPQQPRSMKVLSLDFPQSLAVYDEYADAQKAVSEAIWVNNDAIADNNVSTEEMNRLQWAAAEAAVAFDGAISVKLG